jgi:hypothetical protein
LQAAVDAAPPGATIYLPPGQYRLDGTVTVRAGKTLRGAGFSWARSSLLGFGDASHQSTSNIRGTVLRSTLTTAATPAVQLGGVVAEPGFLRDLAVVGPGSGTSIGIAAGTSTQSLIEGGIFGVAVTNFATGLKGQNVNECRFSVSAYGCITGADLGAAVNNNHFDLLDVQRCTTGLDITSTATFANVFTAFLSQNNGVGAKLRGEHHTMLSPYFEESTTNALEIYGLYCVIVAPDTHGTAAGSSKVLIDSTAGQTAITGVKSNLAITNNAFGTYVQGAVTANVTGAAMASCIKVDTNDSRVTTRFLTMLGKLTAVASSAGGASIVLPHGVAPTAPADGDVWTTSAGMFVRINGVTKSVNLT